MIIICLFCLKGHASSCALPRVSAANSESCRRRSFSFVLSSSSSEFSFSSCLASRSTPKALRYANSKHMVTSCIYIYMYDMDALYQV